MGVTIEVREKQNVFIVRTEAGEEFTVVPRRPIGEMDEEEVSRIIRNLEEEYGDRNGD